MKRVGFGGWCDARLLDGRPRNGLLTLYVDGILSNKRIKVLCKLRNYADTRAKPKKRHHRHYFNAGAKKILFLKKK